MTLAVGVLAVVSICVVAGTPWASAHVNRGGARGSVAGGHGWRQVSYRGYTFQVPRSWPVIDLTAHPGTCVRFDHHAVYLGQPGSGQSCPSNLVGATEALVVQPASGQGAASAPAGTSVEDPVSHRITVSTSRIGVTAAYRGDRAQILAILGSAGLRQPSVQDPAHMAAQSRAAQPVPGGATNYTGKGFDACTAPRPKAMRAWLAHSSYNAIGIYIGGSDRACPQPVLTNGWVVRRAAAGWHFFPLYVGPQVSFGEISVHSAASQAVRSARDAVAAARSLGFRPGSPIYYDMESYSPKRRRAALTFFSSWTTKLHALGYRSGIYSSSNSGISDLAKNYHGGVYAMPNVIDVARWNGVANTADPNVPASAWANHHRIHQYRGNVTQTHGGYTITIDQDYLDIKLRVVKPTSGGGWSRPQSSQGTPAATTGPGRAISVGTYAGSSRRAHTAIATG
ncbi:MAG TPA: glycoside hydrolase domain-containing protein [Streptosporangiaceae bacterium]